MRVYTYVVVEDEDLLRNSLIKKITNLSLPLKLRGTADNGADGLELIGEVCPDIVLLDIMMPVMDGMEMAEKIHTRYPEIKMIIVTGYSDFELARQAIRFGVKEYMLKPIDVRELQDTLFRVLSELKGADDLTDRKVRSEYVIRQMRAEGASPNASKEAIADLIEQYLTDNFDREISLGELAKETGFTPDHLTRIFKKYHEESPIRYLTRIRVEEAKKLLCTRPELGIREVGVLVGYPDPYYFSRVFKEQTDFYPKEYRQNRTGKSV